MVRNLNCGIDEGIMADPARIKTEDTPEIGSEHEERPKCEETEDVPGASKPAEAKKESASEDQLKQEVKFVVFTLLLD